MAVSPESHGGWSELQIQDPERTSLHTLCTGENHFNLPIFVLFQVSLQWLEIQLNCTLF